MPEWVVNSIYVGSLVVGSAILLLNLSALWESHDASYLSVAIGVGLVVVGALIRGVEQ